MKPNLKVLGGGLLSAGPLLVQFGGAQAAWWLGVIFTALGPILLSLAPPERKPRSRRQKQKVESRKQK